MATKVLTPQDCLLSPSLPLRRSNPNASRSNNPPRHAKPLRNLSENRKRREGSGRDLVMGQVTILKRGAPLDGSGVPISKPAKEDVATATAGDEWDPAMFGTGRLGPEPEMVPKEIRLRLAPATSVEAAAEDTGSVLAMSPSPRALPLPSFSLRKEGCVAAGKDLRRLLRLE